MEVLNRFPGSGHADYGEESGTATRHSLDLPLYRGKPQNRPGKGVIVLTYTIPPFLTISLSHTYEVSMFFSGT
jgi:hypothetical protein